MTFKYFSDEELGSKELSSEEIPVTVWNSIVATYNQFVENCALAGNFPYYCPDDQGICGCDKTQLEDKLKGEIPDLPVPVKKIVCPPKTSNSFWNDEKPSRVRIAYLSELQPSLKL